MSIAWLRQEYDFPIKAAANTKVAQRVGVIAFADKA
jgi:hypothetical protein